MDERVTQYYSLNSWLFSTIKPHNEASLTYLTDVDVALHDGVEAAFLDADDFHTQESGTEHGLGAAETLVADGDDLTVGQLVGLFDGRGGGGGGHLLLKVEGDVAKLLLDVADDLALGGGDHGVASLGHDLHQVVGQVAAGQIETQDGVGKGVTLVDGDGVGDTISDVEDHTGGTAGGVEGKDGLDAHVTVFKKREGKNRVVRNEETGRLITQTS